MSGLELVRRLRTRQFTGKILVLFVAHLSDEDIHAYEELHVDKDDVEAVLISSRTRARLPFSPGALSAAAAA